MTTAPRHLVAVWNPAYATDAMDATVALLLRLAQTHRSAGSADDTDVYVWWGKVRSTNRQQPMRHLGEILAMDEQLAPEEGAKVETHLYLTDYRSLYVGHVGEVTADDVGSDENEAAHVPEFYRANKFACDCWFRLFDVRRIVFDDTKAVVEELRKLRNVHYHDRPVSLYGGMVDLPLIVTRDDGARYFEPDVRERLTGGRFWVEFDAARAGVGRMEQELRENLFGDQVWSGFDPAARSFIATAEQIFRTHRDDIAFDFSPMAVEFAKAVEVQVNTVLRRALRQAPARDRLVNIDGRTVDLTAGDWSLGQLAHAIGQEELVNRALKLRLAWPAGDWFTSGLPAVLLELKEWRNPAAHSGRLQRAEASALRNRLMGVGCDGDLTALGRVRVS